MKTLVLSPDDLQNFNKFIYDPKSAAQLAASAGAIAAAAAHGHHHHQVQGVQGVQLVSAAGVPVSGTVGPAAATVGTVNSANKLMALHYYLNHQGNYVGAQQPAPVAATAQQQQQQQQLLAQSQTQLKQLQLKQPTIHQHQQHIQYHHPYYQQQTQQQQQQLPQQQQQSQLSHSHSHSHPASTHHAQHKVQQVQHQQQQQQQSHLPVHALNQNSNFSAASSSTGGTASSHAPTQQSNGSSISPTIISHHPTVRGAAGAVAGVGVGVGAGGGVVGSNSNIAAAANALLRATAAASGVSASPASSTTSSASSSSSSSASSSASTTSTSGGSGGGSANCAKKLKTEPLLSQYNQTERLNFANTYIVWSEEHWRRVIFHDERRFNLDGPDGFSYYFHDLRNYERTLSQRPRGNSVYIYLMICVGGAIHLEVSSAKQRPESCIEAIMRERPNIVSKLGGNTEFVLQDHNWMSHALPTAQELLNAEGLKTQKWPTIAHDLNIMENIWGWLIREVFDGGRKFSRKDDLIFRIKEAWSRLPLDLITNLYSTLPERITELYYTQGVYTNC